LNKIEKQVASTKISSFEKVWFEASGENKLNFNFADMRENLMNAKYGVKDLTDDDFGHNDGLAVMLNKNKLFTQVSLEKLLLHEILHHNVTRARKGMVALNEDIDHYAMAMLGDQDELSNMELGWFDCVMPNCRYHNPVFSDDEDEDLSKEHKDSNDVGDTNIDYDNYNHINNKTSLQFTKNNKIQIRLSNRLFSSKSKNTSKLPLQAIKPNKCIFFQCNKFNCGNLNNHQNRKYTNGIYNDNDEENVLLYKKNKKINKNIKTKSQKKKGKKRKRKSVKKEVK